MPRATAPTSGSRSTRAPPIPGEHAAIIDQDLWDKVHAILAENGRTRSARTRAQTPALLKGLIFGPTGAAMSPTHTRKGNRLYRYYVSQDVLQHGRDACPVGRVPAAEIEAAVIDQLRGVFRQPEIIVGTWRAARAEQDDITEDEVREALLQLDPLWDELFPAEQARIVQLLVERVDVGIDGVDHPAARQRSRRAGARSRRPRPSASRGMNRFRPPCQGGTRPMPPSTGWPRLTSAGLQREDTGSKLVDATQTIEYARQATVRGAIRRRRE